MESFVLTVDEKRLIIAEMKKSCAYDTLTSLSGRKRSEEYISSSLFGAHPFDQNIKYIYNIAELEMPPVIENIIKECWNRMMKEGISCDSCDVGMSCDSCDVGIFCIPEIACTPEMSCTPEKICTSEKSSTSEIACTPEMSCTPEKICTPEKSSTPEIACTSKIFCTSKISYTPKMSCNLNNLDESPSKTNFDSLSYDVHTQRMLIFDEYRSLCGKDFFDKLHNNVMKLYISKTSNCDILMRISRDDQEILCKLERTRRNC